MKDWWKRTGIQIASIYFLLIFTLTMYVLWFRARDIEVGYLILYSFVSSMGSVVTSDIPAGAIAAGNPARGCLVQMGNTIGVGWRLY
jgi:hypothetical protein